MIDSIVCSQSEVDQLLGKLKLTPCPHCKTVGTLNRHGVLTGYQEGGPTHKTVRAQRVFCSNRSRATGCGRTFSVWIAEKVKRLFLSANQLWQFLDQVDKTGNKRQAFASLDSSTVAHLRKASGDDPLNPVAAFQLTQKTFFF